MACNKGHTSTVKLLLEAGAEMTVHGKPDGLTALHAAVVFGGAEGFVDTARILIEKGAPINDKSVDGMLTPLHCASAKGHVECVRLLIEKGADVHAVDKFNSTPLRIAASNANSLDNPMKFRQTAELLITANADINASSAAGNTPLHSIVKLGDVELVKWMLAKGADPFKRNHDNLSSVDNAKNEQIRALLLENKSNNPNSSNNDKNSPSTTDNIPSTSSKEDNAETDANPEEYGLIPKSQWQPDESAPSCTACGSQFTFFNRRHHCRVCGKVFCGKCSAKEIQVSLKTGKKKATVRACEACYVKREGK